MKQSELYKSTNKQEKIEKLTRLSYRALGIKKSKKRDTSQAQARAAIGASLNLFFNQMGIGKALSVDRSNVSHYARKHKENLSFWRGYKNVFNTVNGIVVEECKNGNLQDEIDMLNAEIRTLTEVKNNLKKKLTK
tara:strand:+ start:1094 stop:1498 length:405 start_codon:yes stop_codon:yes gene_type:complete